MTAIVLDEFIILKSSPPALSDMSPEVSIVALSIVKVSTINELVFSAVDTAILVKVALSPILIVSMLSVPTARLVIVALSNTAESP